MPSSHCFTFGVPPSEHKHGEDYPGHPGPGNGSRGGLVGLVLVFLFGLSFAKPLRHLSQNAFWLPDSQECPQAGHGHDGRDNVDQPRTVEVGYQILGKGERNARNENSRPDLHHPAEADKGPDEPKRNQKREERQLPSDHAGKRLQIEARDGGKGNDRCSQCAIGDRCGICNQRQTRSGKRREPEADEHRSRDGDRCAEAGSAFEESTKRKCDEEQLQSPVVAQVTDRALQNLKLTFFVSESVEEDDAKH